MENKLRLDYFLAKGGLVGMGDIITYLDKEIVIKSDLVALSYNRKDEDDCEHYIRSFADRKNKEVKPCDGKIPVIVSYESGAVDAIRQDKYKASTVDWTFSQYISWRYDLEELIKMQNEIDKKEAANKEKPKPFLQTGEAFEHTKTRTKTEYVKVDPSEDNGSYWECARDFAWDMVGTFWREHDFNSVDKFMVQNNEQLLQYYKSKKLYRKVEREITWQEECNDFFFNHDFEHVKFEDDDKPDKTKAKFIELCNIVVNATKGE